jgi:hypothetical protein
VRNKTRGVSRDRDIGYVRTYTSGTDVPLTNPSPFPYRPDPPERLIQLGHVTKSKRKNKIEIAVEFAEPPSPLLLRRRQPRRRIPGMTPPTGLDPSRVPAARPGPRCGRGWRAWTTWSRRPRPAPCAGRSASSPSPTSSRVSAISLPSPFPLTVLRPQTVFRFADLDAD